MNKLLIVVLLVAAGVLVWLTMSKPGPSAPSEPARAAASGAPGKPQMSAARDEGESAKTARAPLTAPPPPRPVEVRPITPEGAASAVQAAAVAHQAQPGAPGEIRTIGGAGVGGSKYGRRPDQGMAEAPLLEVKTAVRRYWGNLPKSGAVPVVTAEELLPPALVTAMNIPPQSRVTMIGDYKIEDPQAFEKFFATPENLPSMKGFTFVTPDGSEVRDYIRLVPQGK